MFLSAALLLLALVPVPAIGATQLPTVKVSCTDLSAALTTVEQNIQSAGTLSAEAGFIAKGLGHFSPGRHFRSVESDFSQAMRSVNDGLDEVEAITESLHNHDDDPLYRDGTSLALADEAALKYLRQYSQVAVIYERAVNSTNLAKARALSWTFSNAFNPDITNTVGSLTSQQVVTARRLTLDEARGILESQNDDVRDVQRSLGAATTTWNTDCPNQ